MAGAGQAHPSRPRRQGDGSRSRASLRGWQSLGHALGHLCSPSIAWNGCGMGTAHTQHAPSVQFPSTLPHHTHAYAHTHAQ